MDMEVLCEKALVRDDAVWGKGNFEKQRRVGGRRRRN